MCICESGVQMGVSWCWTGICLVRFSGLVYRERVYCCMRCACLTGGVCGAGVIRCTSGSMPVMGRSVYGWRFNVKLATYRPPLWSSGQSFWLQIQRSRVRSPALPDFLSSSGSGTGSTQSREVN